MTISKAHALFAMMTREHGAPPASPVYNVGAVIWTGRLPDCQSQDDLCDCIDQFQEAEHAGEVDKQEYAEACESVLRELRDQYHAYQWN